MEMRKNGVRTDGAIKEEWKTEKWKGKMATNECETEKTKIFLEMKKRTAEQRRVQLFTEQKDGEERRIYAQRTPRNEGKPEKRQRTGNEENDVTEEEYLDLDDVGELQVDFDFYDPDEDDFWPVEGYVRQTLSHCAGKIRAGNISEEMAKKALGMAGGSVIKSEGFEDALGVVGILDLEELQKTDAGKVLLQAVGIEGEKVKKTAFLVSERIINMPAVKLAPAMFKLMTKELSEMEGAKKYEYYAMVVPYDLVKGKEKEEKEYLRPEEELFVLNAESVVEIPPVGGEGEKLTMKQDVKRGAVGVVFKAEKMGDIVKEMSRLYDI